MSKPRYFLDTPQDKRRLSYMARRSLGKCMRCKNPALPDKACCQECLEKMARGKAQAREQGLCVDCWKEPALPGQHFCRQHGEERSERKRDEYLLRLLRHMCTVCGEKRARPGKRTCQRCGEKRAEMIARAVTREGEDHDAT